MEEVFVVLPADTLRPFESVIWLENVRKRCWEAWMAQAYRTVAAVADPWKIKFLGAFPHTTAKRVPWDTAHLPTA
jgi:hypothetical protein